MPNRTEARPAKAALYDATGRLPLLRLFSTLLIIAGLPANPRPQGVNEIGVGIAIARDPLHGPGRALVSASGSYLR